MIEALVGYFQDHGYTVYVHTSLLSIYKQVQGQILRVDWAISKDDLHLPKEWLLEQADHRIEMLTAAEKAGPPKEQVT